MDTHTEEAMDPKDRREVIRFPGSPAEPVPGQVPPGVTPDGELLDPDTTGPELEPGTQDEEEAKRMTETEKDTGKPEDTPGQGPPDSSPQGQPEGTGKPEDEGDTGKPEGTPGEGATLPGQAEPKDAEEEE